MGKAFIQESTLSDIADAIRSKNGSSDTYLPSEMAQAIQNIPTGGDSGLSPKDVNFYDYDGTLVQSYTRAEALALVALPDIPNHNGLTNGLWNWTLADITEYYNKCGGVINIGATYTPTDGNTHIFAKINHPQWVSLSLQATIADALSVNWGDGSPIETWGTTSLEQKVHKYNNIGTFEIKIICTSGTFTSNDLGGNCINIDGTISTATTQNLHNPFIEIWFSDKFKYSNNALTYSSSLKKLILPQNTTDMWQSSYCYSLNCLVLSSNIVTMRGMIITAGVTSMPARCTNMYGIIYSSSVNELTIPITTQLRNNIISTGSVARIDVPNSVTSIASGSISNVKVREYHFYSTTPPTLASATALTVPDGCVIYVPASKLNDYKTAQYWSTWATNMVGE